MQKVEKWGRTAFQGQLSSRPAQCYWLLAVLSHARKRGSGQFQTSQCHSVPKSAHLSHLPRGNQRCQPEKVGNPGDAANVKIANHMTIKLRSKGKEHRKATHHKKNCTPKDQKGKSKLEMPEVLIYACEQWIAVTIRIAKPRMVSSELMRFTKRTLAQKN